MTSVYVVSVAMLVFLWVLLAAATGRTWLPRSLGLVLVLIGAGAGMLAYVGNLYADGLAPSFDWRATSFAIASNPDTAHASILLHVVLGLFLIGAGIAYAVCPRVRRASDR